MTIILFIIYAIAQYLCTLGAVALFNATGIYPLDIPQMLILSASIWLLCFGLKSGINISE